MKTPIIANNRGDVCVFETIENAEKYIEPIDIKNNSWIIYDSEGRLLEALVIRRSIFFRRVVLKACEQEPTHANDLRNLLIRFLSRAGESTEVIKTCSLPQLTEKALRHKV